MRKKKKRTQSYEYSEYMEYDDSPGLWSLPVRFTLAIFRWSAQLVRGTWRLSAAAVRGTWRWCWQCARWSWRTTAAAFKWTLGVIGWMLSFLGRLVFGEKPVFEAEYDAWGNPNYEAIHRRIGRRYRRRGRFGLHAGIFLLLNVTAWFSWMPHRYESYSSPLSFTVVTLILLAIHGYNLVMSEAEERAVEREIERRRAEDRHRAREMRLSDDGELIDLDEWETKDKREWRYGD